MWPFSRFSGAKHPGNRAGLGPRGEKIARRFLKRRGLKILGCNFRCPAGEADLIALDKSTRRTNGAETIVFVEVKTRSSDFHTDPASAVDAPKRARMKKIAEYYLAAHEADDLPVRFDIVAIVCNEGCKPKIDYIPDAF